MLSVFTVVTRNHLHRARVLMADVARHLPEARRVVYLADDAAGFVEAGREPFEVVAPTAYAPALYRHLAFALPVYGLCCVLKPNAAAHLQSIRPTDTLLYLDSDTRLYARPEALLAAVERHAIVLTPHLIDPAKNRRMNTAIALSGTFNAGIFALAPCAIAREFVSWWRGQLEDPFRASKEFYFDQVWIGLAPALFDDVHALRHPGYNVAYWNLHERPLEAGTEPGRWRVAGEPLVVYHFSGFDPNQPGVLAGKLGHLFIQPDARWSTLGIDYVETLQAAGARECESWGYEFAAFGDGKPIQPIHRRYFTQVLWGNLDGSADPFDPSLAAPSSGLRSLYHADHPLTRLYRRIRGKG